MLRCLDGTVVFRSIMKNARVLNGTCVFLLNYSCVNTMYHRLQDTVSQASQSLVIVFCEDLVFLVSASVDVGD